jgi:Na+-driven multidrug efflux pump
MAYQPALAIGQASSTFAAQNRGAHDNQRIKAGLKSALVIISITSIIITLFIQGLSSFLLSLFIEPSQVEITMIAIGYLKIISTFFILIGVLYVFRETLRGIGDSVTPMIMGTIDIGMRVIAAIILAKFAGYAGVWWSQPISWAIAASVGIIIYLRGNWQNKEAIN